MIEIKNLTKIYDKNKAPVKALDNVSLVLPDKGLVFVLGKSGSGKSTFLNMLGGLDNATDGDILLNGISIVNLRNSELDKYRHDYVGIIYQNFNLFPNETVKENILSATTLTQQNNDDDAVTKICEDLDLTDKKNQLVKNLSGGQKQRVAIARALIKNPELILADEPTGNLDSKTTKVIFDILKKISKEKLVVIISHDINSAEKYADRIIYLHDGKVDQDVQRNTKYKENHNNLLELPNNREFSDNDIKEINKSLTKHNLKVARKVEKFTPFDEKIVSNKPAPIFKGGKSGFRLPLQVSTKFFKSTIASFVFTLVILTLIITLLALSQTFAQFDGAKAVYNVATEYNHKNFVLNKSYSPHDNPTNVITDYAIPVTSADIELFKSNGYNGNIYQIYNTPVIVGPENIRNENALLTQTSSMYESLYCSTGIGTVVCDYDYLEYIFGNINVLAGSMYNLENNSKLIVTDYFADSILYYDKISNRNQYISNDPHDPYQKITNTVLWDRYQIGAIIDTNYKTRYKTIFDTMKQITDDPQNSTKISAKLTSSKLYMQFIDELNASLNLTYSINPDFRDDYITETNGLAVWMNKTILNMDGDAPPIAYNSEAYIYCSNTLEENTILMNVALYNSLFNKSVTLENLTDFEEKTIEIANYAINQDTTSTPSTKLQLTIVGISPIAGSCMGLFDRSSYTKLAKDSLYSFALCFDNIEQSYLLNNVAKDNFFYATQLSCSAIFNICNIIDIFASVFAFIVIILIFIAFIMIVSHNLRTIKKNQYRIGVYRGLGCPYKIFGWACVYNTLTLVASTFITSIICTAISSKYVNGILVTNFQKFINSSLIADFTFVGFNIGNLSLYMLLVLAISAISMLAPILKLKKLKPNLIINKAE